MVKVEIITIGDEILIGQIVDTNSAWMAVELNKAGFQIMQITSVHDEAKHITEALELALKRADVVLFTGGIGPTNDDITKQTLATFFDTKLVFEESVLRNIEQIFANRTDLKINDLTRAQAMVPESCTLIQNLVGTAPITWFEKEGKVVVSMPGVPYEMKHVMSTEIIPRLKMHFKTPVLLHRTVLVYGYGESALALKIADWEEALPENISLAYLPDNRIVRLRLSGIDREASRLELLMDAEIQKLTDILGDAIVSYEDVSLEVLVGGWLKSRRWTLATAESCTGGNIARALTSVSGSSDYFKGSVVAYANEVKTSVLAVNLSDIDKYGAVSQQVVEQMSEGVRRLMDVDIALATSGIAGPVGGTSDKPVGTVWVAISTRDRTVSREFHFGTLRKQNIQRATQIALLMIREII